MLLHQVVCYASCHWGNETSVYSVGCGRGEESFADFLSTCRHLVAVPIPSAFPPGSTKPAIRPVVNISDCDMRRFRSLEVCARERRAVQAAQLHSQAVRCKLSLSGDLKTKTCVYAAPGHLLVIRRRQLGGVAPRRQEALLFFTRRQNDERAYSSARMVT